MQSVRGLKSLIESSCGRLNAELCYDGRYGIVLTLNGYHKVLWNENPWVVEDGPQLKWQGNLFFHIGLGTVYLVKGTRRDFNNSVYRPRLRGFQEMVRWVSSQPVGFTVDEKVEETWGWVLVNPWLISSVVNRWKNRLIMFTALNEFDPERWPMDLLIEKWDELRKIQF